MDAEPTPSATRSRTHSWTCDGRTSPIGTFSHRGFTRWSHALCLAAFVVALSRPAPVSQLSATSPTVIRPAEGGT